MKQPLRVKKWYFFLELSWGVPNLACFPSVELCRAPWCPVGLDIHFSGPLVPPGSTQPRPGVTVTIGSYILLTRKVLLEQDS